MVDDRKCFATKCQMIGTDRVFALGGYFVVILP